MLGVGEAPQRWGGLVEPGQRHERSWLRYILEEQPRGLADGLELDAGGVKNEDSVFCWWQPRAGWQSQCYRHPSPSPTLRFTPGAERK